MNRFERTLAKENKGRPPVWFMRQAGRYHSHYQKLRAQYGFVELCKNPEVACEATLGPIRDFDFDAAILFSDLLFPLEAMGIGLKYEPGPKLDWHLRDVADLTKLKSGSQLAAELHYQADAMKLIRRRLDPSKGLLGFVGGPLTLYCYAVEGSHQGKLDSARKGLTDGRYDGFHSKLCDLLVENMVNQAEAGASTVAILDTCAGELTPAEYRVVVDSSLREVVEKFKSRLPDFPLVYYSKGTGPSHWVCLDGVPISGLGVDWRHEIAEVLSEWGTRWAIQGNIDPQWLFLDPKELELRLRRVFETVLKLPQEKRKGWICGLGHGVLPKTPESNVRLFLKIQHEMFGSSNDVQ